MSALGHKQTSAELTRNVPLYPFKRYPVRERATIVDSNFYATTSLWITD